jgi:hypothetical protein
MSVAIDPDIVGVYNALRGRDDVVYFLFAAVTNRVKIGHSFRPGARTCALQTGSPEPLRLVGVTTGGRAVERSLHARFASVRTHGEWFAASEELLAYIRSLPRDSR